MAGRAASIRTNIQPRDLPTVAAARLLGLTEDKFLCCLDELYSRGFPEADQTTGNFDRIAVEAWMDRRSGVKNPERQFVAKDASTVLPGRLQRQTNGAH